MFNTATINQVVAAASGLVAVVCYQGSKFAWEVRREWRGCRNGYLMDGWMWMDKCPALRMQNQIQIQIQPADNFALRRETLEGSSSS